MKSSAFKTTNPQANQGYISTPKFSLTFIFLFLIILLFFATAAYPTIYFHRINMDEIPEAHNTQPQPRDNEEYVVTIYISDKEVYVEDKKITIKDFGLLPELIDDAITDIWCGCKWNKVLLKIEGDSKWEFVVKVLQAIKKARIYSVGLITQGTAYLPDYIYYEAQKARKKAQKRNTNKKGG